MGCGEKLGFAIRDLGLNAGTSTHSLRGCLWTFLILSYLTGLLWELKEI